MRIVQTVKYLAIRVNSKLRDEIEKANSERRIFRNQHPSPNRQKELVRDVELMYRQVNRWNQHQRSYAKK